MRYWNLTMAGRQIRYWVKAEDRDHAIRLVKRSGLYREGRRFGVSPVKAGHPRDVWSYPPSWLQEVPPGIYDWSGAVVTQGVG